LPKSARNPFCYREWYPDAAQRYRGRHRWFGRGQTGLFVLGNLIAVVAIILLIVRSGGRAEFSRIETVLILLIPTVPAVGAVLGLWRERRAFEVHAHEYQRMAQIVLEGLTLLEARLADDPKREAEVIHAIGREALHEGARWLLAHRRQPV